MNTQEALSYYTPAQLEDSLWALYDYLSEVNEDLIEAKYEQSQDACAPWSDGAHSAWLDSQVDNLTVERNEIQSAICAHLDALAAYTVDA